MPFRRAFDCLWCGAAWTTRGADDLEGWAQLCPDCLGKAGDNPFLRSRLRTALAERGARRRRAAAVAGGAGRAGGAAPTPADARRRPRWSPTTTARAAEYDDWYLRRGRYERGPIHDTAWHAELDAAGALARRACRSAARIVELAAGTGWWSPLLAGKGELTLYDAAPATLDRARDRLVAHRLRAHLHVRDAWAEPEGEPADALFAGFWLSHVARAPARPRSSRSPRRWLRPGGRLRAHRLAAGPAVAAPRTTRAPPTTAASGALDDGREFEIVKVYYRPTSSPTALARPASADVEVTTTGRFFVLATAVR